LRRKEAKMKVTVRVTFEHDIEIDVPRLDMTPRELIETVAQVPGLRDRLADYVGVQVIKK
jgi:hypothetical protein